MEGTKTKIIAAENPNDKMKFWLYAFLAFSLAAHACFLVSKLPAFKVGSAVPEKKEEKIILRLVGLEKSKVKRQVVETLINKQKLDKADKAFLGKKTTTFARQTKAANSGSFKEAGLGSKEGRKKAAQELEKSLRKQALHDLKFSDLAAKTSVKKHVVKKKKVSEKSVAKGLNNGRKNKTGLSRSSDYLEDIPLGDFTRLNTQEFEFYGFYHRIRQKLEQFWGAKLQEEVEKIHKSGRSIASGSSLLTSLVIKMNNAGEIVKIQLKSTSGIKELDQVAIDSFNQAGPFPNPPQGMMKNGLATIQWGFAVESN